MLVPPSLSWEIKVRFGTFLPGLEEAESGSFSVFFITDASQP